MKKRRPERFSAAKAVKRNARERVGQPRPGRVIPDARERALARGARHGQPPAKDLAGAEE